MKAADRIMAAIDELSSDENRRFKITGSACAFVSGLRTMEVYLRVFSDRPDNKAHVTIANIVVRPRLRGKKLFTHVLTAVELKCRTENKYVEVECVGNARLAKFLERRGYTRRETTLHTYGEGETWVSDDHL